MGYIAFAFDPDLSHLDITVEKEAFRGSLTLSLTFPAVEAIAAFVLELRGSAFPTARLSIDYFGMLTVAVSPRGKTGHYKVEVELSYNANAAKVALVVDYSQILEFSNQLRALIEGRLEQFTVKEF